MMKRLLPFLAALLALTAQGAEPATQKMDAVPAAVPAPPFDTAGGFVTAITDTVLTSGLRDGRQTLWMIAAKDGREWTDTGIVLPREAAAARWMDQVFVTGGIENGVPTASASSLSLADGRIAVTPLPPLPTPVAGASSAVVGDKLYVFGGATSLNPPAFGKDFWILDLKNPTAWVAGPAFPGGGRGYAAATEQYGMFCVFGGRADGETALAETWVFRPTPLEGTKDSGWKRMSDLPGSAAAASAVAIGQAQVMLIPNASAPGDSRPLLFHTLTDAWCAFDGLSGLTNPVIARTAGRILALGVLADGMPAALHLDTPRTVRSLSWIDYAVIVGYFVLLSLIGVYFSRKQESSAEFSLGNRKVRWWAAGISMFATGASAISFMAIPALAFATNLVWLFPLLVFIPAYFVTAYLIFPLLRRMEITSTYEYLERRFNRTLRLIASLQCIVFQTLAKTSVVLVLPALAISSVTGMNVFLSVIIMGVITTIYTAIGGFEAVIWTEVFQAALMILAPLTMIWLCISGLPGGLGEFVSTGVAYHKFDFALVTWDVAVPAFWILMIMQFVGSTVSVAGDQPIIQRVFSSPLKEVRRVNAMSTFCGIFIGIIVNVMGIAIFVYFRANPAQLDPNAQNDQIVPIFVAQAMPVGIAGMVIAAIFAASMSTVASIMNSVATIFTEDFYLRFRPQATDRQRLITLKTASYAVGLIGMAMALLLASQNLKSMMVVWSEMAALLGGGIVGVYTLGMFTKRANGFGAICGAIISIAVTLLVKIYTPVHWAAYGPIAIFTCIAFGYVLSLLSPQGKDLEGLTVFTPVHK